VRGLKLVLGLLLAAMACAQDWQSMTALPAVDFSGLTPAQTATVLKLLRATGCSCGCDMKLAECRVKDPNCAYSQGLASVIVGAIKAGKSEADALAAAKDSKWAQGPPPRKLLEDPISIPVAGAPVLGPPNAPLTIIEFTDFQCPYCIKAVSELQDVMKAYPTQVKLIFKQFPLDIHSQAALAAAAAVAAQKQGKFWELHDLLFAQHGRLSRDIIMDLAAGLKLDMKRFEADLNSSETRHTIARDRDDGVKAGVDGTPALFINGQHYNGNIALAPLKPILDGQLKNPPKTASKLP